MPSEPSPTFRRLLLGRELRELRRSTGLTAKKVAGELEVTIPWVTRIETGQRGIQVRDLRRLFELYEVTAPEKQEKLLSLAREAKRQGWWEPYKSTLPSQYADYVGLEASASRIRHAELVVIPGLLQTEEYARHILTNGMHRFTNEELESRVQVRMRRQKNLMSPSSGTDLHVILDEAVLHRDAGGPEIMGPQLAGLLSASEKTGITLQVLPFSSGVHAGSSGSFVILDLLGGSGSVPYIETVAGDLYLEKAADIEACESTWTFMEEQALTPDESAATITDIMNTYMTLQTENPS